MHKFEDFKVGMIVKHNVLYGRGVITCIDGTDLSIKVDIKNNEYWFYSFIYPGLLKWADLEIISEEQEYEPITPKNIREVLLHNGFERSILIEDIFDRYGDPTMTVQFYNKPGYYKYSLRGTPKGPLAADNFDILLYALKQVIDLKPLPKKQEFDFGQYLLDNGFDKIIDTDNYFLKGNIYDRQLGYFGVDFGKCKKTHANIKRLIAISKIFDELEKAE